MTQNQIKYQELQENKRHNLVSEKETGTHNRATEQLQQRELAETIRTHQVNEGVALFNATETQRSNKAREAETHRANVAKETETNRSNLAREAETHRSNLVNEQLGRDTLAEQGRHNVADETIRDYQAVTQRYTVSPDKLWGTAYIETGAASSPLGGDGLIQGVKNEFLDPPMTSVEYTLSGQEAWNQWMLDAMKGPGTPVTSGLYKSIEQNLQTQRR